ncbi:uncharacterized protein BDW43DRAFT_305669 [Aspergillus alliaceus]|uniref:uncharacterized protein n=1 Tax=Petromyces alliaceus TaxID=209559 RepID=UPI0012A4F177|nr:uncharacterized protein BDW43DRAFT_305669 [Aspergillus alliaceus]KAB8238763.1 hypothetical protein BDW43DRAFT_305669 [Aspergillus alliaceus]
MANGSSVIFPYDRFDSHAILDALQEQVPTVFVGVPSTGDEAGDNISPLEVEERLVSHPSIIEASVLGLLDAKYGEIVGCFVKAAPHTNKLSDEGIQEWVRQSLAWHKTPVHVFWIGDTGVADDFPRTGSGKHQKNTMGKIGRSLIGAERGGFM